MNVVRRKRWSVETFLAWEERQERPWEFDGSQPVAMNGGTVRHDRVCFNIRTALVARLTGGRCDVFGPHVKILAGRSVRYPDVVVACTPQLPDATILDAPVVVFEVLSPSTSRTDRINKARDYLETASIMQYIIVEQDRIAATVLARDGDTWQTTTLKADDTLLLPEIGISFPLAACHVGIAIKPGSADAG